MLGLDCGSAGSVAPAPLEPSSHAAARHSIADATPTVSPKGGSSDGVTCEDAQAQNVEELDLHGGGQADLTAKDYATVLNNGTYLAPCEVPETSKIQICVAVRGGVAIGVTVAIDPSNPDFELCVAKQVRALAFASHPKMDVVRVRF
jgi:hypothetical protein